MEESHFELFGADTFDLAAMREQQRVFLLKEINQVIVFRTDNRFTVFDLDFAGGLILQETLYDLFTEIDMAVSANQDIFV